MLRVPKDAEHLLRLALLFAAGIAIFLVIRAFLLPAGFGELGHFRTGAIAANQQKPLHFAGRAACDECHSEVVTQLAASKHLKVGCESCHGPLAAHVADSDTVKPAKIDAVDLCSRCHAANPSRPKTQPQVDVAAHSEGAACTECHDAHDPAQ
ncbi:MAG: multiheme c-type cytochrome [Nocardioides sp.]